MNLRISLTVIINLFIVCSMNAQINKNSKVVSIQFEENNNFPNNSTLPVLIYKNVFEFEDANPAQSIEKVFAKNNWGGMWRNGIYNFHHYHSSAHEALGIYGGWAEVQLGGPGNKVLRIEKGDLVILPAGIAHKKIDSGDGFAVVGAYPPGQSPDMNYGKNEELERAKLNIAQLKIPTTDPVFGKNGGMFEFWK
jgi:uncharacterized protein YjlB